MDSPFPKITSTFFRSLTGVKVDEKSWLPFRHSFMSHLTNAPFSWASGNAALHGQNTQTGLSETVR